MPFHLLAYNDSLTGVPAANEDVAAVADAEFSTRNSHYIFTEQYNLLAAYHGGATATEARFNAPSLNALARAQIWPPNVSATILADPNIFDLRDSPMPLPENEEIAIEASNAAAGAEQTHVFLWIAPPGWNMNVPRGLQKMVIAATGAVAGTANVWGTLGNLTFSENLRGGWYTIWGMQCFDAGTLAARLILSKPFIHQGRKFRPGIICQEARANKPWMAQMGGLGVFGKFHSFEPPQIEIMANATAASAQVIRLGVTWHGETEPSIG